MRLRKLAISLAPVAGMLLVPSLPTVAVAAEGGKKCDVTVDRNYALDTYYVTRQDLANGDCVCYAQTGPAEQSSDIEGKIAALRKSGECANPDSVMAVPAGYTTAPAAGGAAGSFSLVPALGGLAIAAAGAVIAFDDNNGNNPGSP